MYCGCDFLNADPKKTKATALLKNEQNQTATVTFLQEDDKTGKGGLCPTIA